jgi:hypothetical protein
MFWKPNRSIRKLIPWYINDSLSPSEQGVVKSGISGDDGARTDFEAWKQIHLAVISQDQQVPSVLVHQRIMANLHESPLARGKYTWSGWNLLAGTLLTLSVLILLWLAVQPGVVLQWSLNGDGVTSYRIYRAMQGSSQYEMLKEIPARVNQWEYDFVDTLLVPGKNYKYRVEGIGADGASAYSRSVDGRYLDILPGQLALILARRVVG